MHNNLIKTTLGYHLPGGGNSTYVHVGEAPGEKTAFAQAVKALKLDMLKQDPEQAEYVLDLKPWAESYERNVDAPAGDSTPQAVSVEFNFTLFASVEFGNGGVQQKVEVDEFGDYHYATVTFSDGTKVGGDWYDGKTWTEPTNGQEPWLWINPAGDSEGQGHKLTDRTDPYFLAAVEAVKECKLDGKGFTLPKLPLQIA